MSNISEFYDKKITQRLSDTNKIKNLRIINNKIKRNIFDKYIMQKSIIFDIGIGKGGDLDKYQYSKIIHLYGCDISQISINETISRYDIGFKRGTKKYSYTANFTQIDIGHDLYPNISNLSINTIISMFVIHYFFESSEIFDNFIKNIYLSGAERLLFITVNEGKITEFIKKSGNSICKVENVNVIDNINIFGKQYIFNLNNDVINCIEFIVNYDTLVDTLKNHNYSLKQYKSLEKLIPKNNQLSQEEKEVISLYDFYLFVKE
jgi:mRNA (guanine-N7-)-methyltransferase